MEKIVLCQELWKSVTCAVGILEKLAANPEDASGLDELSERVRFMQPRLSKELTERIVYLFSGAEIEAEDLRDAGQKLFAEVCGAIGAIAAEVLKDCSYIGQDEAEALFQLWDQLPHKSAEIYQWGFDLCAKASASAPLSAFRHTMRIFEEQPGAFSADGTAHPGYVYRAVEQRTFKRCPICRGVGTPYFRALAYRMADFKHPHLPAKLWMRCSSCKNLYTWKYPEALLRTYSPECEVLPDQEQALTAVQGTSGVTLAVWSNVLDRLSTYTGGRRLLEVGIGTGEFLAVALELGYEPDAVEIVPAMAHKVANMLGIPIWCGDFLNYKPNKRYSMITMGDVIEHVTDPGKALRSAYSMLEDDGVLWMSTPNFESAFSRMLKFQDPMWMEPYHISYFNRAGLESLAGKCGFVLREYHVSQRYNGSMEMIFTKKQTHGVRSK